LEAIPAVLIPPTVFCGLLVTLWTYKCMMMVVFQNKIIYMPSVPPFSRSEKIAEYASQCRPVDWTEHELVSGDGTSLKIIEGSLKSESVSKRRTVVIYFQGNASSLPPRLPYLSNILKATNGMGDSKKQTDLRLIALSYRGFWKSKGKPSQTGIELDAQAAFRWAMGRYEDESTSFVIWGQSIGAGVACTAARTLMNKDAAAFSRLKGLLLETPFVDLRAMLVALYPQKFLPYRYLTPFLQSIWDSKTALEHIADQRPGLKVLMLQAGDDEIVPDGQAGILEKACAERGLPVERQVISGALHTNVMMKSQGKVNIIRFLKSFSRISLTQSSDD
jgi:uncharacterized protein